MYPTFNAPFQIGANLDPSCFIIRQRQQISICPPVLQAGVVECAAINNYEQSEVSLIYLPNVIVMPTGAVIFNDEFLIEETVEGSLPQNGLLEENGKIGLSFDETPSRNEICFSFGKYGTFNYSIFTSEMLPSAYLASFVPSLELLSSPIFFPSFMSAKAIETRFELLGAVGMARKRVYSAPEKPLRYSGIVIFKINDRYKNYRISQLMPEVSATLKTALATSDKPLGRNIYVTRKNAPSRRILNMDELQRAVLDKFGFVQIDLDNASLTEQIDAFAKADIVLAEHGAGLANAMFMRPASTVIEIFPKPMVGRYMYRVIANNLRINYVFGSMDVPEGWRWFADDMTVDVPLYEQLVTRSVELLS